MPLVSVDAKAIPMMHTENLSTLVSDSGIVRYRVKAKIWDTYSNGGDSYSYFPEKIHIEQFDSLFQVEVNIVADTAYYFDKKELGRAVGNVVVTNKEGKTFETNELFWNRKAPLKDGNAFYSFQRVKITNPDGSFIIGDNGFRSDQMLTSIFLFVGKGTINVEESADSLQQNTVRSDSLNLP